MGRRVLAGGRRRVRGLGGARFSPLSYGADLVQWLKATADDVTLNGADVSAWADRSANGNDATQGTAADQPLWNSSDADFGGHGSVEFDHANTEWMQADGVAASADTGEDFPLTISMAVIPTGMDDTNYDYFFSFGRAADGTTFWHLRQNSNTDPSDADGISSNKSLGGSNLLHANRRAVPGAHILTYTSDGTTSYIYINGRLVNSGAQNVGDQSFDRFSWGALRGSSVFDHCFMKLAETVVLKRHLNAAEVSQLTAFLAQDKDIDLGGIQGIQSISASNLYQTAAGEGATGSDTFWLSVLCRPDLATAGAFEIIASHYPGTGSVGHFIRRTNAGAYQAGAFATDTVLLTANTYAEPAADVGRWFLLDFILDGGSGGSVELYVNGVSVGGPVATTRSMSVSAAKFTLGAYDNAALPATRFTIGGASSSNSAAKPTNAAVLAHFRKVVRSNRMVALPGAEFLWDARDASAVPAEWLEKLGTGDNLDKVGSPTHTIDTAYEWAA